MLKNIYVKLVCKMFFISIAFKLNSYSNRNSNFIFVVNCVIFNIVKFYFRVKHPEIVVSTTHFYVTKIVRCFLVKTSS